MLTEVNRGEEELARARTQRLLVRYLYVEMMLGDLDRAYFLKIKNSSSPSYQPIREFLEGYLPCHEKGRDSLRENLLVAYLLL